MTNQGLRGASVYLSQLPSGLEGVGVLSKDRGVRTVFVSSLELTWEERSYPAEEGPGPGAASGPFSELPTAMLFSQPCCITIKLCAVNKVFFHYTPSWRFLWAFELAPTTISWHYRKIGLYLVLGS